MKLLSLELSNIKSHVQTSLTFASGITLLSGDIGAGKTSVLQAIEFALFGPYRTDISAQSLMRFGAQSAKIRLAFSLEQDVYCVVRELVRGKNGVVQSACELHKNSIVTQLSPTELKAQILTLLQYPQTPLYYRYTVYTSQEQMKEILLDGSDQRLQTLRRLFGFDTFQTMRDNTQLVVRHLKEQCAYVDGKKTQLTSVLSSYTDVEELLSSLSVQVLNVSEELAIRTKKVEDSKVIYDRVLDEQAKYESVKETYTQLLGQLKLMRDEILQKRDILIVKEKAAAELVLVEPVVPDTKAYAILKQKKQEVLAQLQTYAEKKVHIQKRKEQLAKMSMLNEEKGVIEEKLRSMQWYVKPSTFQEELDALRIELAKSQELYLKYKQRKELLADFCEACEQNISHEHKERVNLERIQLSSKDEQVKLSNYILALQKRIDQHISELSAGEQKNKELQEQQNLMLDRLVKIDRYVDAKDLVVGEIEEFETKPDPQAQYQALLVQMQAHEKVVHTYELYIQKKRELELVTQMVHELKQHLQLLVQKEKTLADRCILLSSELSAYDIQRIQQVKEQYALDQQAHVQKKLELETLRTKKDAVLHRLVQKKQFEEEIAQLNEQKASLLAKQEYLLTNFVPLTHAAEQHSFEAIHAQFSLLVQKWFDTVVEEKHMSVRLLEDFSPIVLQNGYELGMEHLSGGERQALSLAYRLSLHQVLHVYLPHIPTKDILILDEPTDGFSSLQLEKLTMILPMLSLEQLLLVSHDPKLEAIASNILHIEKENHQSSTH
jgi:exonuclease SbcC